MIALERLNQQFADGKHIAFVKIGELILAKIDTSVARAMVAVQGAQVVEWQPAHEDLPVVWRANDPLYETGKSIRGGVPICWPWFGDHPTLTLAHGFVRTRDWQLMHVHTAPDHTVSLHWRITDSPDTLALWPHTFELDAIMHIGSDLRIQLVTHNTGPEPFSITQGLHTYLKVGDARSIVIRGLEATYYLDKLKGYARDYQDDMITIHGAVDRIYFGTNHAVEIEDGELDRLIQIDKEGSYSTVVWNPDDRVPSGMRPEESKDMVCVEAVNAADDTVSVAPDESRILGTRISTRRLT
ncbi:hypothetical protein A9404_07320 [Halothiobacillus diazotrophicus]|uniref:Putative glucose-6-phosphate 1-epimerase n=1 Tax=Halothiobacillus diazotrophicus TaxID=1860122 RepID=A0A191ZH89_9GAMM|nr:D-hexose-6-phosphate mutarotase [Halothiobacillus diazotrophicus]ANJ67218.1 hypothetical protein A9404_07320 [Halothiobacillus diazotrophicus]